MSGPAFSNVPPNASNKGLEAHFQTPGFKDVLSALGIEPSAIQKIVKQEGADPSLQLQNQLQELQIVQINHDMANVIRELGLHVQDVVMVLNTTDDIETIRKRFKSLKEAKIDQKKLNELLHHLGLTIPEDRMVVRDELGGLYIIKKGLQDLEGSLDG